jgi:sugar O-acyltransferase (sialic acid O-acetyltransferase NeuD family)
MAKKLIIISAGKLGREILSWASHAIAAGAPWEIKGFLDDRKDALRGYNYRVEIIGDVSNYDVMEDDVFVCAIGDPAQKRRFCQAILTKGGNFVNLVHPSASIGHNVELGMGTIVAPFCSFSCDVRVGDFVTFLPFANVTHDTQIGSWTQICGHCGINGNVSIGEGVFLGSHSCITPGVKLGDGCFVCAGSIVTRNLPPGSRVFGNPARPIFKVLEELEQEPRAAAKLEAVTQ